MMSRNHIHDRKRVSLGRHIRLISEGGTTLAKSPTPICIDSIQVSQNCTTESHHLAYRATTGAYSMFSLPDTSLFSVPLECALQLANGVIPMLMRRRFQQQGMALSEWARLEVHHGGRIWSIFDQERRFTVRRRTTRLTVFRDPR